MSMPPYQQQNMYQQAAYVGPPQIGMQMPPPAPMVPPPVQAAAVPPGYQPPFNPSGDPDFARAHHDYPHPGEHFFTTKQLVTRYATVFVAGVIIGGVLMFKLFPVLVRVVTAASGGV